MSDSDRIIYVVLRCGGLNRISSGSLSILAKAEELSRKLTNGLCVALAVGTELREEDSKRFSTVGASRILYLRVNAEGPPGEAAAAKEIAALSERERPEIVLFSSDVWGRSVAPQVAALLETGLTADCIGLDIDESGLLLQMRPAFGGSLMAKILCRERRPQMATFRHEMFLLPDHVSEKAVTTITLDCTALRPSGVVLLETRKTRNSRRDLEEERVIFAGGLGLGSKEAYLKLEALAEKLGVGAGASRAAVNAGYADYSQQIGQTGITVCPKLYVAFGISGAIQHLAGMYSAKNVVAVNKDPEAPVFDNADYGVIADCNEVIEWMLDLTSQEKERLTEPAWYR
ncbi:MAG: electron transfer flavoprotein subunit alpha/FixB family protein [Synergistaceae bacterium]|jgi:electron transfer flavoprotein alpha subunit|nr:electron transfer flavoprotein subunit alpha/FixB family protein [Synergistaceae bacterium]